MSNRPESRTRPVKAAVSRAASKENQASRISSPVRAASRTRATSRPGDSAQPTTSPGQTAGAHLISRGTDAWPKRRHSEDLFHDTLKDIYFAEKKILAALPKMAKAAQSDELKAAFEKHHGETEGR